MTPTLELSFMKAKYDSAKSAARVRRKLELQILRRVLTRGEHLISAPSKLSFDSDELAEETAIKKF